MVPNRPVSLWIVDTVPVLLIEISGCNLLVILDNLVDCSLMRRQRLDILLSQLLTSFGNRTLNYTRCDSLYTFLLGVSSGDTKRRDRHASVATGCIRDQFELRLFDGIRDECMLRPFLQDVDKLVDFVPVEADTLAPTKATRQSIVDPSEEFLLTVHDENQRS